jgi:hypothetical protein
MSPWAAADGEEGAEVSLAISRLGEVGGSLKRAVAVVRGRAQEHLRNAGEIQNGSVVVEKVEEGSSEWIRMGWVSFFVLAKNLIVCLALRSKFESLLTADWEHTLEGASER